MRDRRRPRRSGILFIVDDIDFLELERSGEVSAKVGLVRLEGSEPQMDQLVAPELDPLARKRKPDRMPGRMRHAARPGYRRDSCSGLRLARCLTRTIRRSCRRASEREEASDWTTVPPLVLALASPVTDVGEAAGFPARAGAGEFAFASRAAGGFASGSRRLLARDQGQLQGIAGELLGPLVELTAKYNDVAVKLHERGSRRFGGPTVTGDFGFGRKTCIFESHRTSRGVGLQRWRRLGFSQIAASAV